MGKTPAIICKNNGLRPSSAEFDPEVYNRVAMDSRLVDLRALSSTFEVREDYVHNFMSQQHDFRQSFDCTPDEPQFYCEQGLLFGRVTWDAIIKDGNKHALKARCRYNVAYENVPEVPIEYLCLYFRKLARFSTYPYFRSFFADASSGAGLMFPPLPSLTDRLD